MLNPIYRIEGLQHQYSKNKTAISIDHFSIRPETITGLMGPNGSGKSTLLRLLACIESPTSGRIRFNGIPVGPFSPAIRFKVSLLPQEAYLLKRSVFQNVAYGLRIQKTQTDIRKAVNEALDQVGLDPHLFGERKWHELSGGEAQRVALASRLALKPQVLLLDEPTSGVDAASIQKIKTAILETRRLFGTTLLIASHDWEWLEEFCDDIRHLYKGHILGSGKKNILFGPWSQYSDGRCGKDLEDGQRFETTPYPNKDAVAVLNPEDISIIGETPSFNRQTTVLKAQIIRMAVETSPENILVTLRSGSMRLSASAPRSTLSGHCYLPGTDVFLSYSPQKITWIDP